MINTLITSGWKDYELIDSGDEKRLERFGNYLIVKPDPQAIWKPNLSKNYWEKADAMYIKDNSTKGKWITRNKNFPQKWLLKYKNFSFYCKLTPFKHTGIFPEQSIHWDFIQEKIQQSKKSINVLNLFAYTGLSTLAAASAGAKVTHVDASFPTIGWAQDNQKASNLENKPIRWILDDAVKFCERELKRGIKYDAIIMDPPIFGHGPKGEKWDFNKSFPKLILICNQLLTQRPLFIIVNAYAISASSIMLSNLLKDYLTYFNGNFESGELVLQQKNNNRLLSTGIYAKVF